MKLFSFPRTKGARLDPTQRLARLVIIAIIVTAVSLAACLSAVGITYVENANKRAEVCVTVSHSLDKFTDALVRATADPAASPDALAKRAAAVAAFKADYRANLASCD